LPSKTDWDSLIKAAGSDPYTALRPGGTTGFNAQLGGQGDDHEQFSQMETYGSYWTSDQGSSQARICKFSSVTNSVNTANNLPANYLVSVRYVRNA
jgi:uncharacterized protein (TIGR02145 family)